MEFVVYVTERLVDIVAALILRAGYRWVDQFFAATGTNGEADDVWVPLGTHLRTGSGGILSSIGGGVLTGIQLEVSLLTDLGT